MMQWDTRQVSRKKTLLIFDRVAFPETPGNSSKLPISVFVFAPLLWAIRIYVFVSGTNAICGSANGLTKLLLQEVGVFLICEKQIKRFYHELSVHIFRSIYPMEILRNSFLKRVARCKMVNLEKCSGGPTRNHL